MDEIRPLHHAFFLATIWAHYHRMWCHQSNLEGAIPLGDFNY